MTMKAMIPFTFCRFSLVRRSVSMRQGCELDPGLQCQAALFLDNNPQAGLTDRTNITMLVITVAIYNLWL
jgi:hypothetical protein